MIAARWMRRWLRGWRPSRSPDGHGDVVEEAVARAAPGEGVVRSAADHAGNPVIERPMSRLARGEDGGAGGEGHRVSRRRARLAGVPRASDDGAHQAGADRSRRPHSKTLGQLYTSFALNYVSIKQKSLFSMVRAGRVAGRRANSLIAFFNQLFTLQRFIRGIAP